ncbi:MAG TPA: choice-of-anchor Q domain-containing protein [Pyrinomonadaceae bacterium]|jgi:CSLREA domain-containing protein|nr:choice-of-anchor Q domain-containing protein [Pyrinomonadaceae bacterium]
MKIITKAVLAAMITLCFTIGVSSASAATFVVNTTADTQDANPGDGSCADAGSNCSLRAAISEANALAGDDTVTLPAGTYTQSLVAADEDNNAGGDWDLTSNIILNGAGQANTIMQAAAAPDTAGERVLEIPVATSVVVINGVTIRHGKKAAPATNASRGGGIRNTGDLTLIDSTVTLNTARLGGGIDSIAKINLDGVTVSANACVTTESSCFGGGMNISLTGALTITDSVFTGNTAASLVQARGAGMYVSSVNGFDITIASSAFTNNQGTGGGSGGTAGNGIFFSAGATARIDISDTVVSGNSGTGGTAPLGSGIAYVNTAFSGTITGIWDRLTVANNTGAGEGAGISLNAAGQSRLMLAINDSTINGNSTSHPRGGGLFISTVGGGAAAFMDVFFLNSTISGNSAANSGGGLWLTAPTGAVNAHFNFCTIAGNIGGSAAGGIDHPTAGTVHLKNSIVADNVAPVFPDISGNVTSEGLNHIEDTSGATILGTTAGNTTGFDPQLGLLQNNGGPTLTHLLAQASPLRNATPTSFDNCGGVTTDQRGFIRPAEGACDKGAVESAYLAAGPWSVSGTITTSGGMPIRNAEVVLTGGGLPQPVRFYTGNFGQYIFTNLTGAAYDVSVNAKRFRFTPPNIIVNLGSNMTNVNFSASPPFESKDGKVNAPVESIKRK